MPGASCPAVRVSVFRDALTSGANVVTVYMTRVHVGNFNDGHFLPHLRQMMRHAWRNYVKYAWGHNELRPVSKTFHNTQVLGTVPLGATIVDAIDTLFIMGLEEEYEAAAEWIRTKLSFSGAVGSAFLLYRRFLHFVSHKRSC